MRQRHEHRLRSAITATALAAVALGTLGGASGSEAGELPWLDILGPSTTTAPPPSPDPAPLVLDGAADDGRAHQIEDRHSESCRCSPGTYRLTARVRGEAGRAWITVDGRRVGEWAVDGTYRELAAVVTMVRPSALIGVESVAPAPGEVPATVFLDWVELSPAAPQHTTAGRDVLAPSGYPVVLRGVAKGGFEFNSPDFHSGEENADRIQDWNASVVRIFVSQEYWNPGSCWFDPDYAGHLDDEVAELTRRGIYVLVDNHHSQRGDPCTEGANREMADDLAVPFWTDVARRYQDNPLVGFDLYNEPHDVSWEVWRDGGDAGGYHSPGMQALYDAVRATGATNLVFVSGPDWGNDLRPALEMPIDGWGIVYAAHAYCFGCARDDQGMPIYFGDMIAPAVREYPVVITEFGAGHYDLGSHNRRIIDWATAHDVGWVAYSWSNISGENPFGLLRQTGGFSPSMNGMPVRNALRYG